MRFTKLAVVICAASLALNLPGAADAEPGVPVSRWVTGEVVVGYEQSAGVTARRAVTARAGATGVQNLAAGIAVLEVAPTADIPALAAELETEPGVAYAEPNYLLSLSATNPNDPLFADQWGLASAEDTDIDAPQAWDIATGDGSITVAVVDTGVAMGHPDLAGNIWSNPAESGSTARPGVDDDRNGVVDDTNGWDWVGDDNHPADEHGHGTHVAGTVGATGDNGTGVAGVAWDVAVVPLRVLDETGVGTSADVAAAFSYAGRQGFDVVNASFGGPNRSQAIASAIGGAPGTTFVMAAGNDSLDTDLLPSYPCSEDAVNVVCVAATDRTGALAAFSNHGTGSVELAAPGRSILSTVPGGYAYSSGTSMAAPHVAGAAALYAQLHPGASPGEIRAALMGSVDAEVSLLPTTTSGGRLNLARLLGAPTEEGGAPEPAPTETPLPTPQPEPAPSPEPVPEPVPLETERVVTLRVGGGAARGRVMAASPTSCTPGARVILKRNGDVVRRGVTDASGTYRMRTAGPGRYRVVAPRIQVTGEICLRAVSPAKTL